LSCLAANKAASLATLAKSAPEKPGVLSAISLNFIFPDNGLSFE